MYLCEFECLQVAEGCMYFATEYWTQSRLSLNVPTFDILNLFFIEPNLSAILVGSDHRQKFIEICSGLTWYYVQLLIIKQELPKQSLTELRT